MSFAADFIVMCFLGVGKRRGLLYYRLTNAGKVGKKLNNAEFVKSVLVNQDYSQEFMNSVLDCVVVLMPKKWL